MAAIGIDLGGTIVKVGLVEGEKLLGHLSMPVDSARGLADALPTVEKAIGELLAAHPAGQLEGVAMAFAGQVDVKNKRVLATNKKYDGANGLDLVEWARARWNCPFFIDNDARMAAVGEWQYGAGRGVVNIVTMTIGTGIGTAVVNDGRVFRGGHSQFGCLGGHLTVRVGGRKCTCGNHGCVEAESGSWALPIIARESEGFSDSLLSREEKIDYATLFRLAGRGDAFSVRLRDNCMEVWGAAIVTYIHAYDPDVVVLGGGVLRSAKVIIPFLQRYIDENAWTPHHRVEGKCAELGDTSAILGAVCCIMNPQLQ